jgi:hypothetical protein
MAVLKFAVIRLRNFLLFGLLFNTPKINIYTTFSRVLYDISLKREHELHIFEKQVIRRLFRPKRDESEK